MRSRLRTVFAATILLALVAATGSLLGASLHVPGTGSQVAAASLPDDSEAGAGLAIVSEPLVVAVALLAALGLLCVTGLSPARMAASETRWARAPPSC